MMPTERFERHLPGLLEALAEPRTPGYFDDLMRQTAGTSQRAAWTIRERWLPMLDIARQPVLLRPMPWRAAIGLALMLLLIASAVFYGGTHRLPPLFGPARNGVVVHSDGGDLYTTDPVSHVVTPIVTGPDVDLDPIFSPDGTRLLFERKTDADSDQGWLYTANADGSGLVRVSPESQAHLAWYEFSSDGRWVVSTSIVDGFPQISTVRTDGSDFRTLDTSGVFPWGHPSFRPGDDATLLFVGAQGVGGSYPGLYLIDRDGSHLRTLLKVNAGADNLLPDAVWSPDGTRIAFTQAERNQIEFRVHVMTLDAGADRPIEDRIVGHEMGAWFEGWPVWSPDGTRLVIQRDTGEIRDRAQQGANLEPSVHPSTAVIVSVDGTAPEVPIAYTMGPSGAIMSWSPDGRSVLVTPIDDSDARLQQLLWDPVTGASSIAPWAANSLPAWQRLAP